MAKQCEIKVTRRLSFTKQKEICKREEFSRALEALDRKKRELEMTHRLAAELSRRENKEIKCDANLGRIKSSSQSLSNCDVNKARPIKEKVRRKTEIKHAEKIEKKEQSRRTLEQETLKPGKNKRNKTKKISNIIFSREDPAASLATWNKWERKYKKALREEDERISCMVAKKEARDEKILSKKIEVCAAIDAAIDKAIKTFWTMSKLRTEKEIGDEMYQEKRKNKRGNN